MYRDHGLSAAIRQSNAVMNRMEKIKLFEVQKAQAEKDHNEKRVIAKYYKDQFKSKSFSKDHFLV
jgi:ribosomal protein L9